MAFLFNKGTYPYTYTYPSRDAVQALRSNIVEVEVPLVSNPIRAHNSVLYS